MTASRKQPKWYRQSKEFFKSQIKKFKAACSRSGGEHAVHYTKTRRLSTTLPYNDLAQQSGFHHSVYASSYSHYPYYPQMRYGVTRQLDPGPYNQPTAPDNQQSYEQQYVTWHEMLISDRPVNLETDDPTPWGQVSMPGGDNGDDEITVINPHQQEPSESARQLQFEFDQISLHNKQSSIRVVLPARLQQARESSERLSAVAATESKVLPDEKSKARAPSKNWTVHTWKRK